MGSSLRHYSCVKLRRQTEGFLSGVDVHEISQLVLEWNQGSRVQQDKATRMVRYTVVFDPVCTHLEIDVVPPTFQPSFSFPES